MAELSAKKLGLTKADLPNAIIEVIATLGKQGYDAYIVGGGVRDTLLGLNPKDFDAVTDAKPFEVKDIFGKRCRIIGRRFQLAHVYSGREMIEVATFRAPPNGNAHTTSDGMIVRDNVWGDIEQDFARRDFSINALYYHPIKGVVHDFCDALSDIESKTLRLLGHAPVRIEEDPVRLLRALRFKAKLGFEFDTELAEQFNAKNWALLEQVSPHRLYDETQKMFTGGYLVPLLPLLFEYGAMAHLLVYPPDEPSRLVNQVAINTDKRIDAGKSINPAFFYASLLWDNYLYQLNKNKERGMNFADAQMQASIKVIDRQRTKTAIPKFAEQFIRDIWLLQPKLANPRVKQITQLAEHPRFRAGFDFLLLREQCDDELNPLSESTNGMGEWWQTYQTLNHKEQQRAIDEFAKQARRGGRDDRNRRKRSQQTDEPKTDVKPNDKSSTTNDSEIPKHTGQTKPAKSTIRTVSKQAKAEREQLQKLSLGKLAGDGNANSTHTPKPLFEIDADKLAKQLPQAQKAQSQPKAKAQFANTDRQTKQTARVEHNQDKPAKSASKSEADAALSPFMQKVLALSDIPSERKRAKIGKGRNDSHSRIGKEGNISEDKKPGTDNQSKPNAEAKSESKADHKPTPIAKADAQIEVANTDDAWLNHLIEQGERVPHERRRRKI